MYLKRSKMNFSFLLDLLFKRSCPLCSRQSTETVCPDCLSRILPVSPPYCRFCGAPGPTGAVRCHQCEGRTYAFKLARSFGLYEGNLKRLIHHLKFYGLRELSAPLGNLLILGFRNYPELSDIELVLPVPLSEERLKERGFNQSELLAKHLARGIHRPFDSKILHRMKNTAPLFSRNRKEREQELDNAFIVRNPAVLKEKHLLLVDDIYTSGTTAQACSNVLLKEGARSVSVYTLSKDIL